MNLKKISFCIIIFCCIFKTANSDETDLLLTFDLNSNFNQIKFEKKQKDINFKVLNENYLFVSDSIIKNNLDDRLIIEFDQKKLDLDSNLENNNCQLISLFETNSNAINVNKLINPQYSSLKKYNFKGLKEKSFLSKLEYFINSDNINYTFSHYIQEDPVYLLEVYFNDVNKKKNKNYLYNFYLSDDFKKNFYKLNIVYGLNHYDETYNLYHEIDDLKKIIKLNFFLKVKKNNITKFEKEIKKIKISADIYEQEKIDILVNTNKIYFDHFNSENKLILNLENIRLNSIKKNFLIFFHNKNCSNIVKNIIIKNFDYFPWYKYLTNKELKFKIKEKFFKDSNDKYFKIKNKFYILDNLLLKNELYKNLYLNENILVFKNISKESTKQLEEISILNPLINIKNLYKFESIKKFKKISLNETIYTNKNNVYFILLIFIFLFFLLIFLIKLKKIKVINLRYFIILFSIIYFVIIYDFFNEIYNLYLILIMIILFYYKLIYTLYFEKKRT